MPETLPTDSAAQLRRETAAVRLRHSKFGVRKALTRPQTDQAALSFGAQGNYLSARKKLLDTRSPAYVRVTRAINHARTFWRVSTVPFPVAGVRLIHRGRIAAFEEQMQGYCTELNAAVKLLEADYKQLRQCAADRLGDLFCEADYPPALAGQFHLAWEYPSVEPPDYLKELNPALWEAEQKRISERFEHAVQMAEDAFTAEFAQLVAHLTEKLQPGEDGKSKVFRNTAVDNLNEFFERFRTVKVGNNAELEALIAQAQQAVSGVDPEQLRKNGELRTQLQTALGGVQTQLDALIVDRPVRAIVLADDDEE